MKELEEKNEGTVERDGTKESCTNTRVEERIEGTGKGMVQRNGGKERRKRKKGMTKTNGRKERRNGSEGVTRGTRGKEWPGERGGRKRVSRTEVIVKAGDDRR